MTLHIRENIPLAPLTTFQIGGPAAYLVEVRSEDDLRAALSFAREKNLPFFVLALGSNVLISDKGYHGVVFLMRNETICIGEERIEAGAGASLQSLLRSAMRSDLAGMENLAGVPGSVGAAVRGNAGAFGSEMKDFVLSVRALNTASGHMEEFANADCQFGYRWSIFKKRSELIITSVVVRFRKGSGVESERKMSAIIAQRNRKQIQDIRSAGSFFVNPTVSDPSVRDAFEKDAATQSKEGRVPAGWLLNRVGLRGTKIGGVLASEMHPNYFINTGSATAEDVIMLSGIAKTKVRDQFGVQLHEEVTLVGF